MHEIGRDERVLLGDRLEAQTLLVECGGDLVERHVRVVGERELHRLAVLGAVAQCLEQEHAADDQTDQCEECGDRVPTRPTRACVVVRGLRRCASRVAGLHHAARGHPGRLRIDGCDPVADGCADRGGGRGGGSSSDRGCADRTDRAGFGRHLHALRRRRCAQRSDRLAAAEPPQIVAQRFGGLVPVLRVLGEQLGDDRLERAGDVGDDLDERLRCVMDLLVGDRDGVLACERWPARDHLVHHDSQRVEVAARVGLGSLGLLGREVRGRTHHGTGLGEVVLGAGVHRAGDSEVGDLHLAVRADQDVAGLDVAVGQSGRVCDLESGGNLARHLGGLLGGERAVDLQDVGEGPALDLLHRDEVGALVLAPVVHADDVRVREVGGRLGLASEPLDEVLVDGVLGEQHLDRNLAVEQQVARREHVGHSAPTDTFVDLVPIVENRCFGVAHYHCPVPRSAFTAALHDTDGPGLIARRRSCHRSCRTLCRPSCLWPQAR